MHADDVDQLTHAAPNESDATAQGFLGACMSPAKLVLHNDDKAVTLCSTAAEQGLTMAQYSLGDT